jgi:CRISPR system Cascade subunit CasA
MTNMTQPSFNLWKDPWIHLESENGSIEKVNIEDALTKASDYRTIFDPSPLVIVGIHRLLVAILQFIFTPKNNMDLVKLWQSNSFPTEPINTFGKKYASRFDLFSEKQPFLQSCDIPLKPDKNPKTISYLFPEIPAGSEVTHYQHGKDSESLFCPLCSACGLLLISPFATSGGAGIKPSINGVPPLYIIPGGNSLFESLMASLKLFLKQRMMPGGYVKQ